MSPHRHYTTSSNINRYFASSASSKTRVGLIGARGHTGAELIRIIDSHPSMTLTVASSRQLEGKRVGDVFKDSTPSGKFSDVKFGNLKPEELPRRDDVDVWILALPNNLAGAYADALDNAKSAAKVCDLSADYRFHEVAQGWTYGLPERHGQRDLIKKASKISNPGCYASGMQFALLPIYNLIDPSTIPTVFGVSGYSGAGTTPSRKNDPVALKDNLMPYTLVGHVHEREVSFQLKDYYKNGIRFMPHVAPWFRGITLTVSLTLADDAKNATAEDILKLYNDYYQGERLVKVIKEIPEVAAIQNKHHVEIGGISTKEGTQRLVVCAIIDNLLKGAATQAIQNINIMQGLPEYDGIEEK